MKKKLTLTIILIAAFATVAVIAFAVANNLDKFFDVDNTADVGDTEEKAPDTSDNTVYLEDHWSEKAQNGSPSLKELYAECEALVKSGKKIVFEKNLFTEHHKGDSLSTLSESQLSIENKSGSNVEKDTYTLLIATISTCFEDNFYYRDYDYNTGYDRQRDTSFFYSADFDEYGYSSAEEYYNAVCDGECQWSDESYYISFIGKHIVSVQDDGLGENLYEEIKAGVATE